MTIAIMILVLVNTAAIAYLASVIFEIRDKTNNVYPEMIDIFNEQRNIIRGILESMNRWSDLCVDIISHIERVEDMEGDIKDVFEWVHSVDDNITDMRRDIQDTETKLGDLMAVYDKNVLLSFNDLQSLQKDIAEIKTGIDMNAYWKIRSTIENVDTDGDIPKDVITGRSDYPTFLSKKMNAKLEGEDKDDINRDE